MRRLCVLLWLLSPCLASRRSSSCGKVSQPLELGTWNFNLRHMDTATIENSPVSLVEGQLYVYENYFPNRTILYIHVDNLARRTCGASATIKSGGVGYSSVFLTLHAAPNQEIRSVVDVWGTKMDDSKQSHLPKDVVFADMKSKHLFNERRAVNHNYFNFKYYS